MTTLLWILFALFWLAQPVICYGMSYAYMQSEFPLQGVRAKYGVWEMAWMGFLFGPLATCIIYYISEKAKHGLKFR